MNHELALQLTSCEISHGTGKKGRRELTRHTLLGESIGISELDCITRSDIVTVFSISRKLL